MTFAMPRNMVRLHSQKRRTISADRKKSGDELDDGLNRRLIVLRTVLLFFASLLEREIFVVLSLLLLERLRVRALKICEILTVAWHRTRGRIVATTATFESL